MKTEKEKVVCFTVENFDEVYAVSPTALEDVEFSLAEEGALPAKVNVEEKLFCVTITRPDLTVDEIISIFSKYGYRSHLQGG